MSAHFTFLVDPARDLIRIKLGGFFTPDSMRTFAAERRAAHKRLRCRPNQHLTLTDVREMAIQSQEVVAQFGAVIADPTYRARRLGFIAASTLTRMQLQRAISGRHAQVFTDPAEAETWVFADPGT